MISKANENGDIKSIKKYQGQYANLGIQLATISAIYKIIPSFIDIFVSYGVSYGNDITDIYKKLDNIGD